MLTGGVPTWSMGEDVAIMCAGFKGSFALDDACVPNDAVLGEIFDPLCEPCSRQSTAPRKPTVTRAHGATIRRVCHSHQ